MNKIIKRTTALFMSILITASLFTACSSGVDEEETQTTATTTTALSTTETTTESTTQTTTESTTEATTTTTTKKETTTKKSDKNAVFSLSYKDETIKPNDDMESVLDKIGQPSSSPIESQSCMDTGTDYIYSYSGFDLESFKDEDGNETLVGIFITSSKVETALGVKVGMKIKNAMDKCGVTFTDEDGLYVYEKGDYSISLWEDDGKVDSIEIISTVYC